MCQQSHLQLLLYGFDSRFRHFLRNLEKSGFLLFFHIYRIFQDTFECNSTATICSYQQYFSKKDDTKYDTDDTKKRDARKHPLIFYSAQRFITASCPLLYISCSLCSISVAKLLTISLSVVCAMCFHFFFHIYHGVLINIFQHIIRCMPHHLHCIFVWNV